MLHGPREGVCVLWIDLARADTEPLVFSERPNLPPQSGGEDVVSVGDVEIEGRVERAGRGYLLEGRVQGAAKLRCGRCLAEFDFQFGERVELHLLPSAALPQEEEKRLEMGDLEVRFYDEPRLDLAEVAAEQFALTLPMKPLCAETCRGLCPRCGANLNLGPCPCPETRDDRWAPLLDWRPSE
jgi:uncharacterized protein